jgi:hypothetical protein
MALQGENKMEAEDLRYPIGKFKAPEEYTGDLIRKYIKEIEDTPAKMRKAVEGLDDSQLNTPYREDGWTIRQVVHHVPDSHMNAYIRTKLALTEGQPVIKTYEEDLWAELKDTFLTPVTVSLDLLELLHKRWVVLLKSLEPEDLERTYTHPEHGLVNLKYMLGLYSWHGRHHIAHITELRKRNGW